MAINNQAPTVPPAAPAESTGIGTNGVGYQMNGAGNHNHVNTRYSRVEFSRFGGDDLRGWVYRCEQFFDVDGTPEDMKVKLASIHMEGRALQWHQTLLKSRLGREFPNWNDYVRALHLRFGHTLYADPMSELVGLKQNGSVQEFLDKFDELLNQVELTEEYSISCFLNGLKPEVKVQVRMLAPRTLMRAYSLAKLAEQSVKLQREHNQLMVRNSRPLLPTPSSSRSSNFRSYYHLMGPESSRGSNGGKYSNPSNHSTLKGPRKLSATEMDERRAKGLCFWCDEKYIPGHNCKKKK
ncbi:uncharacterized protein [Nicotiana sylvestris]|uniref:uncharacterized protein n=1 Tax=Nicotiana sylvestris TaxID=4096 RepID=UPI00388CA75D